MGKKKNNCKTCPHRLKVNGASDKNYIACAMGMVHIPNYIRAQRVSTTSFCNSLGDVVLELDKDAIEEGWMIWPLYFHPAWVKCYLPIEKKDV